MLILGLIYIAQDDNITRHQGININPYGMRYVQSLSCQWFTPADLFTF